MADLKSLEKKITDLEERLSKLEKGRASVSAVNDEDFMDALYVKAREVVIKNNKASILFLQKKFLIDNQRAAILLANLEASGIVGPETGSGIRKVLIRE